MHGVVYYEILRSNKSITGDRYQIQLNCLYKALLEKRPKIASNQHKVILVHNNIPHVAKTVKETLMQLKWAVLQHPAYSPDLASSDYHLFRSMQHGLVDTHCKNYDVIKIKMCENGSMNRLH